MQRSQRIGQNLIRNFQFDFFLFLPIRFTLWIKSQDWWTKLKSKQVCFVGQCCWLQSLSLLALSKHTTSSSVCRHSTEPALWPFTPSLSSTHLFLFASSPVNVNIRSTTLRFDNFYPKHFPATLFSVSVSKLSTWISKSKNISLTGEFSKIIGYESLNIRDNVEFVRLYGILNGPNDSIGYVDYAVEVFTYPRNTVVFNQKENFTTIDTAGFDFVGSIRLQTGKRVAILKEETESINSLNSSQIWNYFDYVLFCQSDSIQTVLTSDLSVVILDSDNRAHLITSRDIDQYFRSLDSRVANWSHLILQIKQVEVRKFNLLPSLTFDLLACQHVLLQPPRFRTQFGSQSKCTRNWICGENPIVLSRWFSSLLCLSSYFRSIYRSVCVGN